MNDQQQFKLQSLKYDYENQLKFMQAQNDGLGRQLQEAQGMTVNYA